MLGSISQICFGRWRGGCCEGVAVSLSQPGPSAAPLSALCRGRPCHLVLSKKTSHQDCGRPVGALPILSLMSLSTGKKSSVGLTAGHCNWGSRHRPWPCPQLTRQLPPPSGWSHGAQSTLQITGCWKEGRSPYPAPAAAPGLSQGWGVRIITIMGNIDRMLTVSPTVLFTH